MQRPGTLLPTGPPPLRPLTSRGLYREEKMGHFPLKTQTLLSVLSPLTPPSFTNNKTLVPNQGSRCLYVFIYSDIYSVFVKAVCLPGCIPEILKTYMVKATKIKDLRLVNSLQALRVGTVP